MKTALETTTAATGAPETSTAKIAADRPRPKRLAREWQTIAAMVHCYCRDHHQAASGLCPECQDLLDYATLRLDRCRFGAEKPTCAKCPVHCYQRDRREQVRAIMRYAGPRMLWQHPILSLRHWLDGFKPDAESVAQVRCAGAQRQVPSAER